MRGNIAHKIVALSFAFLVLACSTVESRRASAQPLIVLLTDFGDKDHYTGALKGAIYSANPSARIDCITNQIREFDIAEGAYTLAEAAREYPDNTIFVAIVDPGVGSHRKGIAVKTKQGKIFIGPDNGVMWPASEEAGIVEVRELSNTALMHPGEISSTFHGRDIFGPVAGHLAAGTPFELVGPKLAGMAELTSPRATLSEERAVGDILHVDDYGNLITNIPVGTVREMGLHLGSCARVTVNGKEFKAQFVQTYSDVEAGAPLFLSNRGFVELAVNLGALSEIVGATQGMKVIIEPWSDGSQ
jgi:S-adenosylmethionine hydrolase